MGVWRASGGAKSQRGLTVFVLGRNRELYRYEQQQGAGGNCVLAPSMGGGWNGPPAVAAEQHSGAKVCDRPQHFAV